jgi:hypothetical protein
MGFRYLIYSTGTTYTSTIVRESITNNPGTNEASYYTDFIIPEIQPLHFWRVNNPITPTSVIPNNNENILAYELSIAPSPTYGDYITYGKITGMTAGKIDRITGATNNIAIFTADGNLQDGGYTIPELTGLTKYTFTGSGGTQVFTNGNQITIKSAVPSGTTVNWGDITGTLSGQTDLWNILTGKTNLSIFQSYTGTTAPATFLSKSVFNTYSGITIPNTYYNKTQINSYTAATETAIGLKANITSPTFLISAFAPTPIADSNNTCIATTAFVVGQASTVNPLMNGTAAVGTSLRYSRQDRVHPSDTSRVAKAGDSMSGELDIDNNLRVAYTTTTGTLCLTTTPPAATIQQPTLFWDATTKQVEAKTLTGGSDQYFYVECLTNRTTTSTTCQNALSMTVTTLAGRYQVDFYAELGQATSNACVLGAFKIDDVTQGSNILLRNQVANFNSYHVWSRDITLTAASHTFDIFYWNSGGTACIPAASIRVKRIG